jgi:hypothetical protein
MKSIKRGLCSLLAALLCFGSAGQAYARFIALGHVDLSFYEVTANVVQLILERLGYNVGVQKGSHAQIYPLLGKGEVDLFVAAWLPNAHAAYWEQYQDNTTRVTALYDDARLFWSVPEYIPASALRSVADLRKPEVATRCRARLDRVPSGRRCLLARTRKLILVACSTRRLQGKKRGAFAPRPEVACATAFRCCSSPSGRRCNRPAGSPAPRWSASDSPPHWW